LWTFWREDQAEDQAAGGARCAAGRRIEKLRKTIIKKAPLRIKLRKREEGEGVQGVRCGECVLMAHHGQRGLARGGEGGRVRENI
jgi:hypothetical protein